MIDENRNEIENETLALEEEDRLPWLEPVDDVVDENAVSPGRLIGLVLGGLAALALLVGGIWWMQNRDGSRAGQGELIAAAEGDYKVAPSDPGAKQFQGEGDASYKASEGAEVNGKIDPAKAPEAPTVGKSAAVATPPAKTPATKPGASPTTAKTSPAPAVAAAGSGMVQLGAFNSEAVANQAWTAMQKRYPFLAGVTRTVTSATVGGGTVYRLRAATASNAQASDICSKMKAAGENCMVVR